MPKVLEGLQSVSSNTVGVIDKGLDATLNAALAYDRGVTLGRNLQATHATNFTDHVTGPVFVAGSVVYGVTQAAIGTYQKVPYSQKINQKLDESNGVARALDALIEYSNPNCSDERKIELCGEFHFEEDETLQKLSAQLKKKLSGRGRRFVTFLSNPFRTKKHIVTEMRAQISNKDLAAKLEAEKKRLNELCSSDKLNLAYEFIVKPKDDATKKPHLKLQRIDEERAKNKYSFATPTDIKLNWFESAIKKVAENKIFQFICSPPWDAATGKASFLYWLAWITTIFIATSVLGAPTIATLAGGFVGLSVLSIPALLVVGAPIVYGLVSMGRDYWRRAKAIIKGEVVSELEVKNASERELVYRTLYKAMRKEEEATLNNVKRTGEIAEDEPESHDEAPLIAKDEPAKKPEPNKRSNVVTIVLATLKGAMAGYSGGFYAAWVVTSFIGAVALKFGAHALAIALATGPIGIGVMTGIAVVALVAFGIYAAVKASQACKEREQFFKENECYKTVLSQTENYETEKAQLVKDIRAAQRELGYVLMSPISKGSSTAKTAHKVNERVMTFFDGAGTGAFFSRSLLIGGAIALFVALAHPGAVIGLPVIIGVVATCALVWGVITLVNHMREKRMAKEEIHEKSDPVVKKYELELLRAKRADLDSRVAAKRNAAEIVARLTDDSDRGPGASPKPAPGPGGHGHASEESRDGSLSPSRSSSSSSPASGSGSGATGSGVREEVSESVAAFAKDTTPHSMGEFHQSVIFKPKGAASIGHDNTNSKLEAPCHCGAALYKEYAKVIQGSAPQNDDEKPQLLSSASAA